VGFRTRVFGWRILMHECGGRWRAGLGGGAGAAVRG